MEEVHGQCSCGSVAYKCTPLHLAAYQCHCSICRKATGSTFTTTLMVPEKEFQWLRGEKVISTYAKKNGYKVNFCSRCGSPIPNKFREYPLFTVPAGSIEGSPELEIVAQLFLGSKAEWDMCPLQGQSFNEMPGLDEMMELLQPA